MGTLIERMKQICADFLKNPRKLPNPRHPRLLLVRLLTLEKPWAVWGEVAA